MEHLLATVVELLDSIRIDQAKIHSKKGSVRDEPIRFDRPDLEKDEPKGIAPGDFLRQMTGGM